MHAPNFDRDNEKPSGGLPARIYGGRDLMLPGGHGIAPAEPSYPDTENYAADYRHLFFKCLGLALKYRRLIGAIAAAALVLGFILTFVTTPMYRATATIQIDLQAPKVVKVTVADNTADIRNDRRFYQTQYDILRSRSLAERVASHLDLGNAASFLHPQSHSSWALLWAKLFPANTEVKGSLAQRQRIAAARVKGGLSIAPVTGSALVRVSYDSPSPDWAEKIANGVADNFISLNLERRYGATSYARNFLRDRLDELKLKLEQSEKALVDYAEKKQLVTADSNTSLADSDLKALNGALQRVRADRIHYQEQWEQAQHNDGMGLPQILRDPSIEKLRGLRATLTVEYQNKLKVFKPAYPDMRKLKAQIDQVDHEIAAAVGIIKHALKAQYDAALDQEKLLQSNIRAATTDVLTLRTKSIQYNILQREVDTNRTLYNGLLQQYKDVGVAGAVGTNNVSVVDQAVRPGGPFKPSMTRNLLLSLVLGLMVAAIAILVMEILDDTFKSPEDMEEQLGLAVLGIIPKTNDDIFETLKSSPNAPISEACRSFRTALQFSTDQGAPKSILVTSASPGEGKSTIALSLALNFVQLGMRVLLIDADLRNPSQHHLFKNDNTTGLANYLSGATAAQDIFQKTEIEGLTLVTTGPLPPSPAELLASPKMVSLLSTAGEKFDSIIIDAPPVMGLADSPLLSSLAAGTLLVTAAETRRGVVKAALKRLHFARARMIGVLMNKFDFRNANYTYGYSYGYGYGYGALDHYGYGSQQTPAKVEHSGGG